jgi:hypothetical protein
MLKKEQEQEAIGEAKKQESKREARTAGLEEEEEQVGRREAGI